MSETPEPKLVGFGVANYRSFDAAGFVLDRLCKINVFIGKNNSGKSNVLRAIRLLKRITSPKMHQGEESAYHQGLGLKLEIDSHRRNGTAPSVTALIQTDSVLTQDELPHPTSMEKFGAYVLVRWNTGTGRAEEPHSLNAVGDKHLHHMRDALTHSHYTTGVSRQTVMDAVLEALLPRAVLAMRAFGRLICVENFREIRTSSDAKAISHTFNGLNVISRLREMQHPNIGREAERVVFERIQDFVRELLDEPELSLEIPTSEEAIYISVHGNRLPLASYGTGLHQLVILCAALAMHEDHVVCIEEPEIHLHPELQRKFLEFIAAKTNNRYFITTHSNVFLDFRPDVAIYHVTHDGLKSSVARVDATARARDVLADLGCKASDLLQANCVIWVEGPSDRIYLNKWISLIAPDLVEGIHYAIVFYGGKVLAHFTAADDPAEDLVEVLPINKNAFFLMDRDAAKPDGHLNKTKERIQSEIGASQCWVTQGREIENYLRSELLTKYVSEKGGSPLSVTMDSETPVEEALARAGGKSIDYARAKAAHARALCERMTTDDLDALDLRQRLTQVIEFIRRCNHMSPRTPGKALAPSPE